MEKRKKVIEESRWYYFDFLKNTVEMQADKKIKSEALKIASLIEQIRGTETEENIEEIENALITAELPEEPYKKKFRRMIKLLKKRLERAVPDNFGSLIKHLRENKGYSLKELELATGISYSYITRIENGERNVPSYRIIEKLAKALEQNVADLLYIAEGPSKNGLQPVEKLLLSEGYLVDGIPATKEIRESLVEIFHKINDSPWNEHKYKDSIDIMESIDRFKKLCKHTTE
ncbi:helix-turn-helix transcriptional regulator [Paenibacillus sediminis]|uniref:Transcriptional regulator with XRE-family HTH domain n=1 Tax=Paenibacillus sediminis TaxID=664909 RepID=A0ABS4H7N9_9BACL|nr:helix-turn-helix transcriptional regulator [Paenibacillus sediminis]MBP1938529.1 transcriptional regulator with XRE-family HTH domain [Paenibacillus sediminis]